MRTHASSIHKQIFEHDFISMLQGAWSVSHFYLMVFVKVLSAAYHDAVLCLTSCPGVLVIPRQAI